MAGVFEMLAFESESCSDRDLVEEIIVNGSNLRVVFDHTVSIFIHNLVLSFLYLGSTEVRNVIIFKIPGLFSDETGGFHLHLCIQALCFNTIFLRQWHHGSEVQIALPRAQSTIKVTLGTGSI